MYIYSYKCAIISLGMQEMNDEFELFSVFVLEMELSVNMKAKRDYGICTCLPASG